MRAIVVAIALAGCAGEDGGSISELDLDLEAEGFSCNAPFVLDVRSVAIDAVGEAEGGRCRLVTRCLNVDQAFTVDEIEDALRDAAQPLLDIEASRLVAVRVSGHGSTDCADDRNVCGSADIASAEDGMLEVPMTCDIVVIADDCGDEQLPLCP